MLITCYTALLDVCCCLFTWNIICWIRRWRVCRHEVRQWQRIVARRQPASAGEWALALAEVVRWSSGRAWKVIHDRMSRGRIGLLTGLRMCALDLGVIEEYEEA